MYTMLLRNRGWWGGRRAGRMLSVMVGGGMNLETGGWKSTKNWTKRRRRWLLVKSTDGVGRRIREAEGMDIWGCCK